jgi:hypothetical protein
VLINLQSTRTCSSLFSHSSSQQSW